ncbi:MAG TPA: Dabb family protein [Chitinispirillaceae bacterium]|nr:Dabb family protein [Chitinispirillaceae bacterium]
MVKHIVMWKLIDSYEGKNKVENSRIIKEKIEALKAIIPQIKEVEVGININSSDAAYDLCLYSVFDSREDLDIYQNHPEHQKVAAFVAKVKIQRTVCDYQIDS